MASVAVTVSRLSPSPDFTAGNKKFKFRTVETNTGDYTTDGIAITAASFGLKKFAAVVPNGVLFDNEGADQYDLGRPIGVRLSTDRTTAYLLLYESAADGDALDQKPAEAATQSIVSVLAIGW